MRCGTATPTDPGVPQRTQSTGAFEIAQVTKALVGRYRIERVLGEGGMATVYLAEDAKHRRKVAVKVMRPELAATLGAERFLREVQIAAQLNHPNILTMHDSGEANGLLYYVMPYIEGETLKDQMTREGALAPDEALRLAREIAEALAYAHKRGIIHRDIKPANILLNEGHALVADFGIARAVDEGAGEALTRTGLAVGTPQYMAPEQAAGDKDVDGRADVYATGAILYEMLSGAPPFTGPNARSILTRSLIERPQPLTVSRPGLSPVLDTVVQKALAKGMDERYASAADFVAAIDSVRGSSPSNPALTASGATQVLAAGTETARAAGRWRSPRMLAVAAVAVVGLMFAARGVLGLGRGAGDARTTTRVVVLPFENQGAGADEYLAEGISDEVRGKLAKLSGLEMIASTSARQYKGSTKSPQAIAKELDAQYLLVGRVRWTGEGDQRRVRVMPELIDGATGSVKWQQTFEVELSNVLDLQTSLASQVTGALGVTLVGGEQQALAQRPTDNVAAYDAYLRAQRRAVTTESTLRGAMAELEQAVALDSNFTDAWAELVRILANLHNSFPDSTLVGRGRHAVRQIERLAPGSAALHLARSRELGVFDGDGAGSQRELEAALRLAPNDVSALIRAAGLRNRAGDLSGAIGFLERARELDPRSPTVLLGLVRYYNNNSRFRDALAATDVLVAVLPSDVGVAGGQVEAYLRVGDMAGARAAIKAAAQRGVPLPALVASLIGTDERGWVLEDADQRLGLRLTPSAFDGKREWWAQSLATLHWQRGDTALARVFADSALGPTRKDIAREGKPSQHDGLLGVMLAYLGRAAEARAAAARGLQHTGQQKSYNRLNAAKAEAALGDRGAALAHLEQIPPTDMPALPTMLRHDPAFATLKGDPRYERLLQTK
jgi:TolB-like protein/tRNA A-37 threonylcarbamoyl transferase component Bud32/tetratricopeptide (TPR) repeat protein